MFKIGEGISICPARNNPWPDRGDSKNVSPIRILAERDHIANADINLGNVENSNFNCFKLRFSPETHPNNFYSS